MSGELVLSNKLKRQRSKKIFNGLYVCRAGVGFEISSFRPDKFHVRQRLDATL
jgi:hypothetical protein